jgi:NADH-quinone oxidoreductase subunit C
MSDAQQSDVLNREANHVPDATRASSLTETINRLVERFNVQVEQFRGDYVLEVRSDQIISVCQALREVEGFEMMIDETAVDFWPQETPRFHVVYQFRSVSRNLIISLRVPLDGNEPVMPSLVGVYPNADWYERELWDLFGIRFAGHPDLRRILMPHDWAGHPLRKDYPLGYEEPQFTFNYDKIQAKKLNPKE